MPLSDRDRQLLDFESTRPRHGAAKEEAIRGELGLSPARYYQLLGRVIDSADALAHDPMLVHRLRRLREERARSCGALQHSDGFGRVAFSGAEKPYPKDRFDELPADARRLGAHRADNPRTLGAAGWVIALVATLALIAAGVIGTLLATDRLSLFPQPSASTPAATIQPVLDTSFSILLIDASGQDGVVAAVRAEVLAAGWSEDKVSESSSDASDFETTTVYYAAPEDQAAARGLADAIGVEWVELNDSYQPVDDPQTTDVDEGGLMQLVVAIGRDRLAG